MSLSLSSLSLCAKLVLLHLCCSFSFHQWTRTTDANIERKQRMQRLCRRDLKLAAKQRSCQELNAGAPISNASPSRLWTPQDPCLAAKVLDDRKRYRMDAQRSFRSRMPQENRFSSRRSMLQRSEAASACMPRGARRIARENEAKLRCGAEIGGSESESTLPPGLSGI